MVWLVWLLACSTPEADDPVQQQGLVSPLDQAASTPWVQQVVFVAANGERVEGIVRGDDGTPVATLVAADGARRAVRVGPFGVRPSQVSVRPDAAPRRSLSQDGVRVSVAQTPEAVEVAVVDTSRGGRTVLLRERADRDIVDPTLVGGIVIVREAGELGGLYALSSTGSARIVPERAVSHPVPIGAEDGGALLYAEEGPPAKLVVARPPAGDTLGAAAALAASRVPTSLASVHLTPGDEAVRIEGCGDASRLALRTTGESVTLSGVVSLEAARGFVDDGLWLLGSSDAGAPRVLAALRPIAAGRFSVWTTPEAPRVVGTFMGEDDVAALPRIPGCPTPRDPSRWLSTQWARTQPGSVLTHVRAEGDLLMAQGRNGASAFLVTITDNAMPLGQAQLRVREPPGSVATAPDGSTEAEVVGGALVLRPAGAEPVTLVPQGAGVAPHDPAFSLDGRSLWFADRGGEPGLVRLDLEGGRGVQVSHRAGLHRPQPLRWSGQDQVAWLQEGDEGWAVGTVRPLNAGEEEAYGLGAVTLLDLVPVWLPVAREGGELVRCSGGERIEVGATAEGGFLQWGETRVEVRALAAHGGGARVLGEVDGDPIVVADLRTDRDLPHWWPRHLSVVRKASAWLPQADAMALAEGGPCTPR